VDSGGNLNLVGETRSPNFPTTPGAFDASLGGLKDAFVAVMDPAGHLLYSTYLGGGGDDAGLVLDLGSDGTTAVAGKTVSGDFPTTPGAFDPTFNGGTDVFVSLLRPGGAGAADLAYSTYLGGSDLEGVFPDPDLILMGLDHFKGNGVVVAASTRSDDLPLVHPYQAARAGEFDIFVSALRPNGRGALDLVYSTYVGSPGTEQPMALVADASGSISVGGGTWSAAFPTTPGALQEGFGGGSIDAVWFRLDPHQAGAGQLVYSTYWGGNSIDHISDFELDPDGDVIAVGWTGYETGPPTDLRTSCGAYDTTPDGFTDGFVMRFAPQGHGGADLSYCSLLGGPYTDGVFALSVVSPGPEAEVLAAGWSSEQPDFQGPSSGILAKLVLAPQIERYGPLSPNSVGPGAVIGSSCSASVADNAFALHVAGAVPGQVGFFFYGPKVQWAPLGDGVLCVGGGPDNVYAVLGPPQTVDAAGNAARWVDLGAPPAGTGPAQIAWGSTWSFQFVYLDPAAGGAGYNLSDALRVAFTP
jgi:hypothetical protein